MGLPAALAVVYLIRSIVDEAEIGTLQQPRTGEGCRLAIGFGNPAQSNKCGFQQHS
jgi:hypothetical protein